MKKPPDPDPRIIEILKDYVAYDILNPQKREELARDTNEIINAWDSRANVDELKDLLGLIFPRGRRRTAPAIRLELAIAVEYARQFLAGASHHESKEKTANKFSVDDKKVERAWTDWRDVVRPMLDSIDVRKRDEVVENLLARQ